MGSVISTVGLTKLYSDRVVVNSLDLEVMPGEIFGLLGPNGAGKTTTILMLLGLTEPTSGSIEVLGLDPRSSPLEVKRRVGYLPDAVGFYERMTARQNLRFTARLNRIERAETRVQELLDMVGLGAEADQRVGEFSRGMRQRLGIADALVKDPSILILDEPTTAIDPEGVAGILRLMRGLARERGVSVLLASHLLNQVQAVCDRVAIFVDGSMVAHGSPARLAARYGDQAKVEFRILGDPESARSALAGLAMTSGLFEGESPGSWVIGLDMQIVPEVIGALVNRGFRIAGVRRIDEDLDAVYRRYFQDQRLES